MAAVVAADGASLRCASPLHVLGGSCRGRVAGGTDEHCCHVCAGDVTEDAMQRMSSSVGALQARLTSFAAAVAASVASMKSTAAAASTEASDRIADLQ
jgi:hypothetical protein